MMKQQSKDLYQLIHSLNSREKQRFKLYAARQGIAETKGYTRLFDAIGKQRTYDEKQLLKVLGGNRSRQWLSTEKFRLYNTLLQSLHYFHRDTDINLATDIHLCRILYRKGLYRQAWKVLQKAQKTAVQYEKYEILRLILEVKILLVQKLSNKKQCLIELKRINEKNIRLRFLADELWKHRYAWDMIATLGIFHGLPRNRKEKAALKKYLFVPAKLPEGRLGKSYYYSAYGIRYRLLGKLQKSCACRRKAVETLETRPELLEDASYRYTISLYNLIVIQVETKKYREASDTLYKLKKFMDELRMYSKLIPAERVNLM